MGMYTHTFISCVLLLFHSLSNIFVSTSSFLYAILCMHSFLSAAMAEKFQKQWCSGTSRKSLKSASSPLWVTLTTNAVLSQDFTLYLIQFCWRFCLIPMTLNQCDHTFGELLNILKNK